MNRTALGFVLLLALTPTAIPLTRAQTGASTPSEIGELFGFRIGEERRYILGPPERLPPGDEAVWIIRLHRITEGGGDFSLHFQRVRERGFDEPLGFGDVSLVFSSGMVSVNNEGFPVDFAFSTRRTRLGVTDERYAIGYRFDARRQRFEKEVRMDGRRWRHDVFISRHDQVDKSVPRGVFAFMPPDLRCARDVQVATRSTGMDTPSLGYATADMDLFCRGRDPLFANPGLLGFLVPQFWQSGGDEREFLLLAPPGPILYQPVTRATNPGESFVGSGVPGPINDDRDEFDVVRDPSTYYHRLDLQAAERTEVTLGRRTLRAWKLSASYPLEWVYVDDAGTVLRVDLARVDDEPRRWIRLIFPSEY